MSHHRPVGEPGLSCSLSLLPIPNLTSTKAPLVPSFLRVFQPPVNFSSLSPPKHFVPSVLTDPCFHPRLLSEPMLPSLGKSPTLPTCPSPMLTPFQVPLPSIQATRTAPSFPAEAAPHALALQLSQPSWKSRASDTLRFKFAFKISTSYHECTRLLPSGETPGSLHGEARHCHF